MRNVHDVGGQLGYGPIPRGDERPFHADWERLAFGLTIGSMASGFVHSIDENRYAKERMRPLDLAGCSYYELWLAALEMNLVENGVLTLEEIISAEARLRDSGEASAPASEPDVLGATLTGIIDGGVDLASEIDRPRRYRVGETVRVDPPNDRRHSRVPTYAAGRLATVVAELAAYPVPGVVAHGLGTDADWCYQVRFEARTLWRPDGTSRPEAVYLDVWEADLRDPDDHMPERKENLA